MEFTSHCLMLMVLHLNHTLERAQLLAEKGLRVNAMNLPVFQGPIIFLILVWSLSPFTILVWIYVAYSSTPTVPKHGQTKTRLKIARVWPGLLARSNSNQRKIGCQKMPNVCGHPKLAMLISNQALFENTSKPKKARFTKVLWE